MFGLNQPFWFTEEPDEATVRLLKSVTLGSNGARYRHLGIEHRIHQLYRPLFVSIVRRDRVLANATFCRRASNWYVRYFAFDQLLQARSMPVSNIRQTNGLKWKLNAFFDNALLDPTGPQSFYAYIDPRNERSLNMSANFGFTSAAKIATQTFSRLRPKNHSVEVIDDLTKIKKWISNRFGDRPFFHDYQTLNNTPFYVLRENGEIVAFAKVHRASWQIERLPGKNGALLTRLVPFIPIVNRIIQPAHHCFGVVDAVWSKNNDKRYLSHLFEGILAREKVHVLHWWVDHKDSLYRSARKTLNWGLLHKINGVHNVDLVVKTKEQLIVDKPVFVSGFDFI